MPVAASHPFKVLCCDKCDAKWHSATLWRYFVYALPDGRKISIEKAWAWCDDCHSFEAVECLPTHHKIINEIMATTAKIAKITIKLQNAEKEITKATTPPRSGLVKWLSAFARFILNRAAPAEKDITAMREEIRFKQRTLDELLTRRDFLAARTAPAKCLTCGGSNISYVDLPEAASPENKSASTKLATRHTHRGCGGRLWLTSAEKNEITTAEGMRLYDHNGSRVIPQEMRSQNNHSVGLSAKEIA